MSYVKLSFDCIKDKNMIVEAVNNENTCLA